MAQKIVKKKSTAKPSGPQLKDPLRPKNFHYNDPTKIHPALEEFFCYCIYKAAVMYKNNVEKALEEVGIGSHHIGIMMVINHTENINQNQVGEEIGVDKASIVKIIDFLEKKGMIERRQSPKDRRVNFLNLTPAGKKAMNIGASITIEVEKQILGSFSGAERATIKKMFLHIMHTLGKYGQE